MPANCRIYLEQPLVISVYERLVGLIHRLCSSSFPLPPKAQEFCGSRSGCIFANTWVFRVPSYVNSGGLMANLAYMDSPRKLGN
jgi:hypothetical protein